MKAVHITGRFCLFTFRWNFIFTLFSNFRLNWRKYLGNLGSRVSQHKKKCHLTWELLITIDHRCIMCYIFAIITLDLTCSNRFSKVNFLWHFVALSFLYKMYIPWPLPPTSGSPGKLSGDDKRRTRSTIRNHKAPRWGALIYASDCLQEGILIKENPAPPENIEKLDIYEIQENYNLLWLFPLTQILRIIMFDTPKSNRQWMCDRMKPSWLGLVRTNYGRYI